MPLVVRTTGVEEYLDASGQAHIKALILGEPSAGKTRSASFWPKPIFADCEKGRMSLADRKVPYVEITSTADMDAFLDMLDRECVKPVQDRKFQTAVIDTFDSYQRVVIQEILRAQKKDAMSGWQDWGALDAKMNTLVSRLHKLPMNIVVNSHIKRTQDGSDGPLINEPKLKGDLREQISAEFDLVGHMATFWEAENGERVLKRAIKWHPEPNFPILKDRSGQLPKFTDVAFTESDYTQLFERMFLGDHFDSLTQGEAVDELPLAGDDIEAPRPGGPLPAPRKATPAPSPQEAAPKPEPAPKKAVKRATKATSPAASATVPGPVTYSTPDAPTKPPKATVPPPAAVFEDPQQTLDAAHALVTDQLGGQVVSEEPPAEPAPVPTTATATPPADPGATASPSTGVACGTAATSKPPVPGCGRNTDDIPEQDMVNIAVIRTKTYLCPDCFMKWKQSR
jgi:hypothetical protein